MFQGRQFKREKKWLVFGSLAFCFGVIVPGLIFIKRPLDPGTLFIKVAPSINPIDPTLHPSDEEIGSNNVLVVFGQLDKGSDPDINVTLKRDFIRMMMKDAWDDYEKYAWGHNELKPISKQGHSGNVFGTAKSGATIVDSLDTLFIMGFNEEYKRARDWVAHQLNFDDIEGDVSVFETNIRFVGGFLAMYSLTGDTMYKDKAYTLAKKLLPAFDTVTGIPYSLINLQNMKARNYNWTPGGASVLSEFGTFHLEFMYLSDVTGDPIFREKVEQIRRILNQVDKPRGLYYNYLHPNTTQFTKNDVSMGGLGDSFYEYLLKAYVQSGDFESRNLYDEVVDALENNGLILNSTNGLLYIAQLEDDKVDNVMGHLACFAGGMFALGAYTDPTQRLTRLLGQRSNRADRHMRIAEGITNTCHESYVRTATRLGPESFGFRDGVEARALSPHEQYYILRPEVIESYFVMWRLTGDVKYREWGWDAATAIEKYCKVGPDGGYTGLMNVYDQQPQQDDVQQSFFLAETLKYLYLLFSSNELMDLDYWVFNTEAHPLPIKGANPFYRPSPSISK